MPAIIEHIDAIARKKQRDVLYVTFQPSTKWDSPRYDWETDPIRQTVTAWLTKHHVPWWHCAEFADENSMMSYMGQIYLDIPIDDDYSLYQQVRDYLEHPDGKRKFASVGFWYLTLEMAQKNAHHDAPGFWEQWAENF